MEKHDFEVMVMEDGEEFVKVPRRHFEEILRERAGGSQSQDDDVEDRNGREDWIGTCQSSYLKDLGEISSQKSDDEKIQLESNSEEHEEGGEREIKKEAEVQGNFQSNDPSDCFDAETENDLKNLRVCYGQLTQNFLNLTNEYMKMTSKKNDLQTRNSDLEEILKNAEHNFAEERSKHQAQIDQVTQFSAVLAANLRDKNQQLDELQTKFDEVSKDLEKSRLEQTQNLKEIEKEKKDLICELGELFGTFDECLINLMKFRSDYQMCKFPYIGDGPKSDGSQSSSELGTESENDKLIGLLGDKSIETQSVYNVEKVDSADNDLKKTNVTDTLSTEIPCGSSTKTSDVKSSIKDGKTFSGENSAKTGSNELLVVEKESKKSKIKTEDQKKKEREKKKARKIKKKLQKLAEQRD